MFHIFCSIFHAPCSIFPGVDNPPLLRFTEVYTAPILAFKTKVVFNSPFPKGSTREGEGFLVIYQFIHIFNEKRT